MHACMHTYIHTYTHTHTHTHTQVKHTHTRTHPSINPYIHPYIYTQATQCFQEAAATTKKGSKILTGELDFLLFEKACKLVASVYAQTMQTNPKP
jgi:carbohydrate-binding DOMON domain-containing protein